MYKLEHTPHTTAEWTASFQHCYSGPQESTWSRGIAVQWSTATARYSNHCNSSTSQRRLEKIKRSCGLRKANRSCINAGADTLFISLQTVTTTLPLLHAPGDTIHACFPPKCYSPSAATPCYLLRHTTWPMTTVTMLDPSTSLTALCTSRWHTVHPLHFHLPSTASLQKIKKLLKY